MIEIVFISGHSTHRPTLFVSIVQFGIDKCSGEWEAGGQAGRQERDSSNPNTDHSLFNR